MFQGLIDYFNSDNFIPHGHCFLWQPDILWLQVLSDAGIALAYFTIPFALIYFVRKRKDLPFSILFWLFGAFILLCGTTHLMNIWVVWHPDYATEGVIKALTAIVSLITAVVIVKLMPDALLIASPTQLLQLNKELKNAHHALEMLYEEKNKSHEARLRAMIDSALDAVISFNEDGGITEWNPQAKAIFGWQAEQAVGKPITDVIIPPEQRETYRKQFLARNGGPVLNHRIEVPALHRSGNLFPAELTVTGYKIQNEYHFTAFVRDITKRKQAEEKTGLLAAIVQSSEDAIISRSLDDQIMSWNAAAEKLFGYSAAEAIGQYNRLIVPLDKLDEEQHVLEQLRKGKRIEHYESVRMARNGHRIEVALTNSPIYNTEGQMIGASKIVHDITERKLAEKRLQTAHKYVEEMLNHIPDPIFMKDRQHRWIGGNKAFWEIMQGAPEQFIGKSDYEFFPKEEADAFWERDDKVFTTGEVDLSEEYFTDAQGNRHVFYTKKAAFRNDADELFLVGVIRDITRIKEAEANLLRYTQALEHSNKELDDFAYIASHDLKEPLRGIHNHARFLLEDNEGKLDAESITRLKRLVYLTQRMERLVNDLLYYSRLGRQDMAIGPADLNTIIQDIENTLDLLLSERHARIVVPRPLPVIDADRLRLTEALRNLITNAVKYNDKLEKIVEIGYLENAASPDGMQSTNVFYIKDNGKGIAREFHEEVFRIFKRLQSDSGSPEEGTGVGLTFVKKIIERHGGRIWLESEMGKGTIFYFTLR